MVIGGGWVGGWIRILCISCAHLLPFTIATHIFFLISLDLDRDQILDTRIISLYEHHE